MSNIFTIGSKKENNAQLYLDILIITEVLLHGTQRVTINGLEKTLVSHVFDFVKKEGICFTNSFFAMILKYIQDLPLNQANLPILSLLGSKNNDTRLAVEEFLRLYYTSTEKNIPLFGQKQSFDGNYFHDFSIEKIEHLFYDYKLLQINTRIKEIKSELKEATNDMTKTKTLLVEFQDLQNRRNELYSFVGTDIIL